MRTFKVYGSGAGPGIEVGTNGEVTGDYDVTRDGLIIWIGRWADQEPDHLLSWEYIQRVERVVYGDEDLSDEIQTFTVYADNVPNPSNPYGFGSLLVNGNYIVHKGVLKIWYARSAAGQPDLIYPLKRIYRVDSGDTRPADGPWA